MEGEKGSYVQVGTWGITMNEKKMDTIQLYITHDLHGSLEKTFGHGRMSANVERILRAYLKDPTQEKALRLNELQRALRNFNSEFGEKGELIFPQEEKKKED
jgi:hypothetical protein